MRLKTSFLLVALVVSSLGWSQISFLETILDAYPQIEVKFNYRDPAGIDSSKVRFYENGKSLETYNLRVQDSVEKPFQKKQVLVIVENSYWPRFSGQLNSVKRLWSDISDSVFLDGDEFYLASFDWSLGGNTLIFSKQEPFSDATQLNAAIQRLSAPVKDGRLHESTEIYSALREGIRFLSDRTRDSITAPVILLFSSEFNNVFNNSQTKSDVIIEARKAGVPIYAFRYSYSNKYDLADVAQTTYGKHIDMSNSKNNFVIDMINNIPFSSSGTDYVFSYNTHAKEYGDLRKFEVELSNEDRFILNFQAPTRIWILLKQTWFRLLLIAVLLVLAFFAAWVVQFYKKRKLKERAYLERIKSETERKIEESEMISRVEKQSEKRKLEYEKQQVFEANLNRALHALPRLPRLVMQNGSEIEINQPIFTVGRLDGNSLTVDNNTLSKTHAVICFDHSPIAQKIFNDRAFYLIDSNSTNGTLLNGKKVSGKNELEFLKPAKLRNNDLIQMGEISFTFFE